MLDAAGLDWCDVYGKCNVDPAAAPSAAPSGAGQKVVPVGPCFGLRLWGLAGTAWRAGNAYAACARAISHPRYHFGAYWKQFSDRLPLEAYEPKPSRADYVFTVSAIWKDDERCNAARALFITACRQVGGVRFEGGFYPRTDGGGGAYAAMTATRRYSIGEYVAATQRSAVVFNTPAVVDCHSWKLGEFFALGKAIVTTPPARTMPEPLEHGENVHVVEANVEAIRDAVERICRDGTYRRRLERGARAYYERHLRPARVIGRLVRAS